ncbi:MAG: acetolactate synthase large subunit [Alphaproteobacteria bacterium]|nr:acetolactate synthase large subunit [Alphaproteobacteria bacterium]
MTTISGAEAALRIAASRGIDLCIANPGTTELDLVTALDRVPAIKPVLALAEGVCAGTADGFARIAGRPALTLTHLGPGFANSIANLHNARRARSPVVNLIGDQASWHLAVDAPLTSDIESLARPVSAFYRKSARAEDLAGDMEAAIAAAVTAPGQVATLTLPADFQRAQVQAPTPEPRPARLTLTAHSGAAVEDAAKRIRAARKTVLVAGGNGLSARGQAAAARIAKAIGGVAYAELFVGRADRGRGIPALERFPYFPEAIAAAMKGVDLLVAAGTKPPVGFFGYEGYPSRPLPLEQTAILAEPGADAEAALEALAEALEAPPLPVPDPALPAVAEGALTPPAVAALLVRALPENAIAMIEGSTCGVPFFNASPAAKRYTLLTNPAGGAIGMGLPAALGAALAAPERRVVCLHSDGGAQYSVQALWSMARQNAKVTVLIAANRRYGILLGELARAGINAPGPAAKALLDFTQPAPDWVALAKGYGVPAERVADTVSLAAALPRALAADSPHLLELAI